MCVIFHKLFAGCKKYKIKHQYETTERDKIEKDYPLELRVREARFEELKKQLTTQQSLSTLLKGSSSTTDTHFVVAQIIGKHTKPFSDRECIKQAALGT